MNKRIVIIGGGLAGLTAAILLRKSGLDVLVIEKNEYPFHRVCGEYVSNEVIPFLKENDLWPGALQPVSISRFELSDTAGRVIRMPLDLGGFGISRYALDAFFAEKARQLGVEIQTGSRVEDLRYENNQFLVNTREETTEAFLVIGAYGKRSHLDKQMNRGFMQRRSPYIGVKYHVTRAPHAPDTVALHNFRGGYCGINAIEDGKFNLCYLSHRDNLREHKDIQRMEQQVLWANPQLKAAFTQSEFLWDDPLVINEISFETKEPVINHMLMCGDAAGMITPLCGNGMAMAIHSSKILADVIIPFMNRNVPDRKAMESAYRKAWREQFAFRLSSGRKIQQLFGHPAFSRLAVRIGQYTPPVARYLMSKTHGVPFS